MESIILIGLVVLLIILLIKKLFYFALIGIIIYAIYQLAKRKQSK